MKRMVLIPEEKLLRYEERDKELQHGGGEKEEEAVRGIPKKMKKGAQVLLSRLKEESDEEREKCSLTAEMIVRGIPKTMKTRAQALLARLKERKDMIKWDSSGQVTLNGVFIPKSNISDLISDAMRPRKHFNPVGVRKFYDMLNEINIPKDLVRNEKRWSEVNEKPQKVKVAVSLGKSKKKKIKNWIETEPSVKRKRNQTGGWYSFLHDLKHGNLKDYKKHGNLKEYTNKI